MKNLNPKEYREVQAFAQRIEKFVETDKEKPYFRSAFERFYKFVNTLSEKDHKLPGAVANTVGNTSDYNNGIVAKCSRKQCFILAIGAVEHGINL